MNDALAEKTDLRCAGAGPPGCADPGVAAPFLDACASIEFLDTTRARGSRFRKWADYIIATNDAPRDGQVDRRVGIDAVYVCPRGGPIVRVPRRFESIVSVTASAQGGVKRRFVWTRSRQ
jgi:hypothetical protein